MLARAGLTSVRARSPRSADVWRPALSVGQARLSYAQRAFHASVLAGQIAAQAGAGAGNAAAPAPATPKPAPNQNQSARKFWKAVTLVRADPTVDKDGTSIPEHWQVRLDGRALRTPERKLLHVPLDRPLLASLLAREWDQLDTVLRPHSLPVTSLVSRAIEGLRTPAQRKASLEELQAYLDTDTICFPEDDPPVQVELQQQWWSPILAWARDTYKVPIQEHEGIVIAGPQSDETHAVLRQAAIDATSTKPTLTAVGSAPEGAGGVDPLALAAFERAVRTSKSFLVGLALVKGQIDAEVAAQASQVEVNAQIHRWGEVEDTHDVDKHDVRRQLAAAALACVVEEPPQNFP